MERDKAKILVKNLRVNYYRSPVLKDVNLILPQNSLTVIVGPSGCGKSTLLMALNRLLDSVPQARVEGQIKINLDSEEWVDIRRLKEKDLPELRRRISLVFQHPNVLPMSIYKNASFPLRLKKMSEPEIKERVIRALIDVYLWDEVKDRLDSPAAELSGGQQQRLCLARTLVLEPEVLLLDEPTSFLDEALAHRIESLLLNQKKERTVVVVSHYMDQVKRISDQVYFLENA